MAFGLEAGLILRADLDPFDPHRPRQVGQIQVRRKRRQPGLMDVRPQTEAQGQDSQQAEHRWLRIIRMRPPFRQISRSREVQFLLPPVNLHQQGAVDQRSDLAHQKGPAAWRALDSLRLEFSNQTCTYLAAGTPQIGHFSGALPNSM